MKKVVSKLIPVIYNDIEYPSPIKANIHEIAGNFDVEDIMVDTHYSLHTEYSFGKRSFKLNIFNNLKHITSAQKNGIPQLWYNKEWAEHFLLFIERLIDSNDEKPPEVLEIHPPFVDYCSSFKDFMEIFKGFYVNFKGKYPSTKILIENRYGTMNKNDFLLSKSLDVLEFCKVLSSPEYSDIDLKIVLDYPQLFSAEKINLDTLNENDLKIITLFNKNLIEYRRKIGGLHMWGKRKDKKGKWAPHQGDFDTFFSNREELKLEFLSSVFSTFNDDMARYFVPEVNSRKGVHSVVKNMIKAKFNFESHIIKTKVVTPSVRNKNPTMSLCDI